MSDRLEKFLSLNKTKVDRSLAQRWDFDVQRNGEVHIKAQIAQAKRTGTMLTKASSQFSNVRPEQELALKAAVSTMRQLALELEPLVPWAKAYRAFCVSEWKREEAEELEAIAQTRWGGDETALRFEADLVLELATKEGQSEFGQWLHSLGEHLDVPVVNMRACMEQPSERVGVTLRERMASEIKRNGRDRDNKWGAQQGMMLICSFRTYERYLAHRKDIAAKAAAMLKGFAA
jgi:hypothetical protein